MGVTGALHGPKPTSQRPIMNPSSARVIAAFFLLSPIVPAQLAINEVLVYPVGNNTGRTSRAPWCSSWACCRSTAALDAKTAH